MLTDKYLKGIPTDSRAARNLTYLNVDTVTSNLEKVQLLDAIAQERGQKLSQMAIAWILRQPQVASVLIGASSANQLKENVKVLDNLSFTEDELGLIDKIISKEAILSR
jgi:L-glyceraldehyde 3-phosphate reductase